MKNTEYTIKVDDLNIKVIKKNIKNINIAVCPPNGTVGVSAPNSTKDEDIRSVIISKMHLIKKHQKLFINQQREDSKEFVTGEKHYFLGNEYLLKVHHYCKKPRVILEDKKIKLFISKEASRISRERIFYSWYRQEFKKILPAIIKKWELKTNLKVSEYRIKRMKTRWGTCNPFFRRIWLNLELIKKPINCIEYVVVHEIVHFIEKTHNYKFVANMNRFMPNWQSFKKDLNNSLLGCRN